MPLVTSRGYNLQSNPAGSAMQGYQQMGGLMDQRNARQQRDIQQGLAGEQREWLAGGGLAGDNALEESAKFGLDFQKKIAGSLGFMDKQTGRINAQKMDKLSRFAFGMQGKSYIQQNEAIIERARTLDDPTQTLEMLDMPPEERKEMFETMAVANLPAKDFGKFLTDKRKTEAEASAPPKPMTENQKLLSMQAKERTAIANQRLEETKKQNIIKNDLGKLNAQISKETNTLKKKEMQVKIDTNKQKLVDLKSKADLKAKKITSSKKSIQDSADDIMGLINKIVGHPGFSDAVGFKGASSLFGMMGEPMAGSDAAGTLALIENLQAKNFLEGIKIFKQSGGAGSLSDNEGKQLSAAISNLKTSQGEDDFKANLDIVADLVTRGAQAVNPDWSYKTKEEKAKSNELKEGDIIFHPTTKERMQVVNGQLQVIK